MSNSTVRGQKEVGTECGGDSNRIHIHSHLYHNFLWQCLECQLAQIFKKKLFFIQFAPNIIYNKNPLFWFCQSLQKLVLAVLGVHLVWWCYFFSLNTNNQSSKVKAKIRSDEAELFRFNIVKIPLSLVKPNSHVKSESSLNNMTSLKPILCLPFIEKEKGRKNWNDVYYNSTY